MAKGADKRIEARKKEYEAARERLLAEGYREEKRTISVLKANIMALLTAGPFAVLACIIYFSKWEGLRFGLSDSLISFALVLVSIPIHELVHGAGWSLFCKNGWGSIEFGFLKPVTPYCHCKESLKFGGYIFGVLLPFIVIGILPFIIALLVNSSALLFVSVINMLGAGGDTTIALMLLRYRRAVIIDHPTECGFTAFMKP